MSGTTLLLQTSPRVLQHPFHSKARAPGLPDRTFQYPKWLIVILQADLSGLRTIWTTPHRDSMCSPLPPPHRMTSGEKKTNKGIGACLQSFTRNWNAENCSESIWHHDQCLPAFWREVETLKASMQ